MNYNNSSEASGSSNIAQMQAEETELANKLAIPASKLANILFTHLPILCLNIYK